MLYRAIHSIGIEKDITTIKGTNSLLQEFVKRHSQIYQGADLAPRAYPVKHYLFVINWSGINMVNNIVGCMLAINKVMYSDGNTENKDSPQGGGQPQGWYRGGSQS